MQEIKIKYFSDQIEKLCYIGGKSDWIDLRAAEKVTMKAGEFRLIPLGIAMELPNGYEAHVVPRSSTFKNFGIIQTNHMGVIDETYCGEMISGLCQRMLCEILQSILTIVFVSSVLWNINLPYPFVKWNS